MRTPGVRRGCLTIEIAARGCAISIVPSANGAQSARIRRIGLALGDDTEGGGAAFRETLRELNHVEGQNLVIEARGTNAVADLARMDLELVVVQSPWARQPAIPTMPLPT